MKVNVSWLGKVYGDIKRISKRLLARVGAHEIAHSAGSDHVGDHSGGHFRLTDKYDKTGAQIGELVPDPKKYIDDAVKREDARTGQGNLMYNIPTGEVLVPEQVDEFNKNVPTQNERLE